MTKFFTSIKRLEEIYRPRAERMHDYAEVEKKFGDEIIAEQAKRCMECGIPFCHGVGCPVENYIPEINAAWRRGDQRAAWDLLSARSSMPEFTSRVCPALCEGSCTVSLNLEPVMIRQIEKSVSDYAFQQNWVLPTIPEKRNGKKIAIIGGGPAGLSAAIALNKKGFSVTIYERRPQLGGLLRYGIPQFKLDKKIIDRRVKIIENSGVKTVPNTNIGVDISIAYLAATFDAVLIASGTPAPRDLSIPGRDLSGIYFALDFLNGGESAENRKVLIIGGGDTGSDCVGMSVRQGARSILQIEIMPKPPVERSASTPWPQWPYKLRTSSSHYEGGERQWNLQSKNFYGKNGSVQGVAVAKVEWELTPTGKPVRFKELPGNEENIEADLVLLAMGFLKPEHNYGQKNIFVIGDAASGPSLVVRAIADGRKMAEKVARFLQVG